MKTEMAESLVYSWLRHIRGCQVVQTNWKTSPKWSLCNEDVLLRLMNQATDRFQKLYEQNVFKGTNTVSQLLGQGEIDAIGVTLLPNGARNIIAADVAFHSLGLLYGRTKVDTALAVAKKCLRSVMCLAGYFNTTDGQIIFATPKITPGTLKFAEPAISSVNDCIYEAGLQFSVTLLANEMFFEQILHPVLGLGNSVADTSELFLRGYQLYRMFKE